MPRTPEQVARGPLKWFEASPSSSGKRGAGNGTNGTMSEEIESRSWTSLPQRSASLLSWPRMPEPTTRHDVFVIHSGHDRPTVERLCIALRHAGIEPWYDDWSLLPGDPWIEVIEEALAAGSVVLACITANALERWQGTQLQMALDLAIAKKIGKVVPLLLPGAPNASDLRGFLGTLTALDLRSNSAWNQGLTRLAKVVELQRQDKAAKAEETQVTNGNNGGEVSDETLLDELALVFSDEDTAVIVARAAGLPAAWTPTFRQPLVFWSKVIEEARNGAFAGGVQAVARAALRRKPTNLVFKRYLGQ